MTGFNIGGQPPQYQPPRNPITPSIVNTGTDLRNQNVTGNVNVGARGANSNDRVTINDNTSGNISSGANFDIFSLEGLFGATQKLRLNGGTGDNAIEFKFNTKQAVLQDLKNKGYSFVVKGKGYELRNPQGGKIDVDNIGVLSFSDGAINLQDPVQFASFRQDLANAGIPLLDERPRNKRGTPISSIDAQPNSPGGGGGGKVPKIIPNAINTGTDLRGQAVNGTVNVANARNGSNDRVIIDDKTRGTVKAGANGDVFQVTSFFAPNQQLTLNGGDGNDGIGFSAFNAEGAFKELKNRGFSFVLENEGYTLKSSVGGSIRVRDIEGIGFTDRSFQLNDPTQASQFFAGLAEAGVPVVDNRNRSLRGTPITAVNV